MYPADRREFHDSKGEEKAFYALRSLPERVTVIHSFRWLHPGNQRQVKGEFPAQGEGDFVLFDPDQGLLVLEVKGGEVWCEHGEWRQKNRRTGVVKTIYPEEQAGNTVHRIRKDIVAREPSAERLLFCHAIWFPDYAVSRAELPMNCPAEIVLDAEDLARVSGAIDRVFSYWRKALPGRGGLNAEPAKRVFNALLPTFSLVRSVRQGLDEREAELVQLTQEQARVVHFLDEQSHAAIHGAAGTGKTLVALEKARRMASPSEPVLFLCYNAPLRDHLRHSHSMANVHFATFGGFAREMMGPAGTLRDAEDGLVTLLLEDGAIPYTHVIIDEAQDFEPDWLEALAYRFRDGVFYVFYDRNQLVQQGDPKWLDDVPCRLVLTRNCRNTDAVARVAYRAAGLPTAPTLGVAGTKPVIHVVSDEAEAIRLTETLLKAASNKGKVAPEELAVLTLNTLPDDSAWHTIQLNAVRAEDRPTKGHVTLSTARRFKGLEATLVIVADAEFGKAMDPDWRRRLYVACSRARQAVHIISATPERELGPALRSLADTDKVRTSWRSLANLLGARLSGGEADDPFEEPRAG